MELNSQNYFEYKKSKMKTDVEEKPKPISKINYLFQLFVATFIIIFLIIVVSITKYSKKIDIEYAQNQEAETTAENYDMGFEEEQGTIDKRLIALQQEENAPSEAKIIQKTNENEQIMAPVHVKEIKKTDKIEKIKELNEKSIQNKGKIEAAKQKTATTSILPKEIKKDKVEKTTTTALKPKTATTAAKEPAKKNGLLPQITPQKINGDNVTIMSKVLIGRYANFDDATRAQLAIKEQSPSLSPFVRKIGDVYSIQMGSYQDFYVAKTHAQKLKAKGYDVWIYQQ